MTPAQARQQFELRRKLIDADAATGRSDPLTSAMRANDWRTLAACGFLLDGDRHSFFDRLSQAALIGCALLEKGLEDPDADSSLHGYGAIEYLLDASAANRHDLVARLEPLLRVSAERHHAAHGAEGAIVGDALLAVSRGESAGADAITSLHERIGSFSRRSKALAELVGSASVGDTTGTQTAWRTFLASFDKGPALCFINHGRTPIVSLAGLGLHRMIAERLRVQLPPQLPVVPPVLTGP